MGKRDGKVKADLLKNAERAYAKLIANGETRKAKAVLNAFTQLHDHDNPAYIYAMQKLKNFPVTIEEFVSEKDFLGQQVEVWPAVLEDLKVINKDLICGESATFESIFAGAIGCHAKGTGILMADGTVKNVEDVKIGDFLIGPDGLPREVLNTVCGKEKMYRITPNTGGEPFIVNQNHILHLRYMKRHSKKINGVREIINITEEFDDIKVKDFVNMSEHFRTQKYTLKRYPVDIFPLASIKDLPIDPRFLGMWLGDGSSGRVALTTMDDELDEYFCSYAKKMGSAVDYTYKENNKAHTVCVTHFNGTQTKLSKIFYTNNLINNKHIPYEYKIASRKDRLELLAGIVDTDGHLTCGGYEIAQKNLTLANDIMFVARSLGFCVSRSVKYVNDTPYQRITITGNINEIPVLLERKKASPRKQIKPHDVSGFSFEELDEDWYYGFALSGDHLYLTEDFTVHHNTGKSASSMITCMYQLYQMSCFDWPQEMFQLTRATPIETVFLSIRPKTAETTLYKPFRSMLVEMPYAKKYMQFDKNIESEIRLDQNLFVRFNTASIETLIGKAIVGGIVDEINFYARVERSKLSATGGTFDQGAQVYTTLSRRRRSRFTTQGPNPGVICVPSSTKYKNDFTDRRIDEIIKNNEKNVVFFRHKQYEVVPQERFCGETFRLLVGTDRYPTKILNESDTSPGSYPEDAVVEYVPIEYIDEFKKDPESALRDIVGVATNAITPYFSQRNKINDAVIGWNDRQMPSWTEKTNYILQEDGMPEWIPENFPKDGRPLFVHVDLAISGDRCGIAICSQEGTKQVGNEALPVFIVEWVVTLEPNSVHQVDIGDVRRFITDLKTKYGLNVARVSMDSFQSTESIQMIRKLGIPAVMISVDRTMEPYETFKRAVYDNRCALPDNDLLYQELAGLEYNQSKNKVDHPAILTGKDASDAVCGAVYNCATYGPVKASSQHVDLNQRPVSTNRPGTNRPVTVRL